MDPANAPQARKEIGPLLSASNAIDAQLGQLHDEISKLAEDLLVIARDTSDRPPPVVDEAGVLSGVPVLSGVQQQPSELTARMRQYAEGIGNARERVASLRERLDL